MERGCAGRSLQVRQAPVVCCSTSCGCEVLVCRDLLRRSARSKAFSKRETKSTDIGFHLALGSGAYVRPGPASLVDSVPRLANSQTYAAATRNAATFRGTASAARADAIWVAVAGVSKWARTRAEISSSNS